MLVLKNREDIERDMRTFESESQSKRGIIVFNFDDPDFSFESFAIVDVETVVKDKRFGRFIYALDFLLDSHPEGAVIGAAFFPVITKTRLRSWPMVDVAILDAD
ncbi:hypothetical protein MPER_07410 [Moniliophthora perniciosa FA553]|nr:hypothetical protein MPER_07410 [Moniliophthora perniciosa FA553]